MIRSILFQIAYWLVSIFFVLAAVPLTLLPGTAPVRWWVGLYARSMTFLMRRVGGIDLRVAGQDNMPEGPVIFAAKHQSWGDGFFMLSVRPDLAFVTGDHLLKFPFLGPILRKVGAVVVNNCGGVDARQRLMSTSLKRAKEEGRSILIYPEGHLSPVGTQHRYKKGVFHIYKTYGCPVVPVATDLGLRWPQQSKQLTSGPATLELLEPIDPGLDKETFMARLETAIEEASLSLLEIQHCEGTAPADAPQRPKTPIVVTQ